MSVHCESLEGRREGGGEQHLQFGTFSVSFAALQKEQNNTVSPATVQSTASAGPR